MPQDRRRSIVALRIAAYFCFALTFLGIILYRGCGSKPLADRELIVGEWGVVDFQSPSATEDRGQRRKKLIVSQGTWSQQFQNGQYEDFEYEIDSTKTPKEITLFYTAPDARRLTIRGIYELAPDRLRVCIGAAIAEEKNGRVEWKESVRPTSFDVKFGLLITYLRNVR